MRAEARAAKGDFAGALADVRAFAGDSEASPQVLHVAYRLLRDELAADAAPGEAAPVLAALRRLRPDNPYLAIESLLAALDAEDRAGATGDALRLREILGFRRDEAGRELDALLAALEGADLPAARVAAARLRNLLLPSPEIRQGRAELQGEQPGVPVERLVREPESAAFGSPAPIVWRADAPGSAPPGLAAWSGGDAFGRGARIADLDGDGAADLVVSEGGAITIRTSDGRGGWSPWTKGALPETPPAAAIEIVDLDLEGDLDIVTFAADGRASFLRAAGDGRFALAPLELPLAPAGGAPPLALGDLDRDGDADFVFAGSEPAWLENRLGGGFARHPLPPSSGREWRAAALADAESDGDPDLWLATDAGLERLGSVAGDLARGSFRTIVPRADLVALAAFDGDNDGRIDFAAATGHGLLWIGQRENGAFAVEEIAGADARFDRVAAGDLDGDGDLDLVAEGPAGRRSFDNDGGNRNRWLDVRLAGLRAGNGKNSRDGLGARIELVAGSARQWREVTSATTRFGIGDRRRADVLRVVWPNGVVQDRIGVGSNIAIVEEQVLKGSCPFLYVWNGERVEFVTDLLWGAPIGMPVAPGVWAGADPTELVRADGLAARDGVYDVRITEELWEAAYFDSARLWVVDHPETVEVASNLRVVPGRVDPERVFGSRALEPVVRVVDAAGDDVTERVARRDELYAGRFAPEAYQGVATPWSLAFDLPRSPAGASRLHLDGWIFPSDSSLNIAVAQRPDIAFVMPRIEVESGGRWLPLVPDLGLPPGKTKTVVVDLPPLPAGARRLRIMSSHWLAWDRIAWTERPADDEVRVVARLAPLRADLRARGFSTVERLAPNAPHRFRYERLQPRAPWQPFPGRYTRFGDVRALLDANDDQLVVLASGDEMAIAFDASALPPLAAGERRTLFLESTGWDKDADRHTFAAASAEPLPFQAMTGYPFAEGERYPATPELERYRREWLTREVRSSRER